MPTTFYLGDDVEALVVLQELVFHVQLDGLCVLGETIRHPDDGLGEDLLSVSLVKLQRLLPSEEYACHWTELLALHALEVIPMLVAEHKVADHKNILVLGFRQVIEDLFSVISGRVDVIKPKLTLDAWVELAHGEVNARNLLLPVDPHLHFSWECVDIQRKRLTEDPVNTHLGKLFGKIIPSLVGTVFGVTATLVL